MYDFFVLIKNLYTNIFSLFDSYTFDIGNFEVSYFSLIFAFLVIGLVISVFWRGART